MENIVIGFVITVCIIGMVMLIAIPFIVKPDGRDTGPK
jgi:hypothetical protein